MINEVVYKGIKQERDSVEASKYLWDTEEGRK